ncbi:MAG TPA: ABC transporter ATP-binding protein [Acidimicrobiales bacterium]|nr:ABC transporter ATP-binding protein [Acidimicrobiales bacterium]
MNTVAAIEVGRLRKGFGSTEVLRGIDVRVPPGTVLAVLGPSGGGKTTLLRTIAGLERLDSGVVRLGGRLVAGPGTHVAPERRRIGMVFQDWALFPHLSVARNVGYGLPRGERRGPRVDDVLAMVGLGGLGDRHPGTLSGGQQQRVALARALAPRPEVLLLDEPFSNLDAALRAQVRAEVHALLSELGITTVFVTHDQDEAFLLGDEVAIVSDGRVVQHASPAELYARPATAWVASFVGDANLIAGEAAGPRAATAVGDIALGRAAAGDVRVLVRPEELRLDPLDDRADGVPGTVEEREFYGHDTVYVVQPRVGAALRIRAGSQPRFGPGDAVAVRYDGPPTMAFGPDGHPAPPGGPEAGHGGARGGGASRPLPGT